MQINNCNKFVVTELLNKSESCGRLQEHRRLLEIFQVAVCITSKSELRDNYTNVCELILIRANKNNKSIKRINTEQQIDHLISICIQL